MTRPTILDSENVALLDLTPSGRAKPAWAAAAEKAVAQQMASLTASVMRHAGDDDPTAWDDVRKYVEGLERSLATCEADRVDRIEQCDRMANDWADFCASIGVTRDAHEAVACEIAARAEAAEARIAELEAALDEKEVASGLTTDGNLWRFWSTKASTLAVRNAELEKRMADAERVIEPFAKLAGEYDPPEDDDNDLPFDLRHGDMTIGQLRAARAYMEGK